MVPLNVVFGVPTALVLARNKFRGKSVLQAVIDLPFAVSPVVVGVALILLWGTGRVFGFVENSLGFKIIFGLPGIVLASIFVTVPFVIREVEPVLHELGTDQEEAAATLGSQLVADVLADHASLDPVGADLRHRPDRGPHARRVRRGDHGVVEPAREVPDADPSVSDRYNRGAEYGAYAISTLLMAVAVLVLVVQVVLDARRAGDPNSQQGVKLA